MMNMERLPVRMPTFNAEQQAKIIGFLAQQQKQEPELEPDTADADTTTTIRPPDFSDSGNAVIFRREYGKDLIWVDALGWLAWNGRYWENSEHKAFQFATELSERMLDEAKKEYANATMLKAELEVEKQTQDSFTGDDALARAKATLKQASKYLAHAKMAREVRKLKDCLEASSHFLTIPADRLDKNPLDLNTPAGIVNLKTGEIRPHEREAYCTHITTISPERNHPGDTMWEGFLDDLTCNDADIKRFLQIVAGMSLIGKVYHEGIILLYGDGMNGKTTYTNALTEVLGTSDTGYAGDLPAQVLTTDRSNKLTMLETIRGKRLVSVSELDRDAQLSESMLKTLANRKKTMKVERKYKQAEDVVPTHTTLLDTNHLPRVSATDKGTWRRLTVVPFNAHFTEDDSIPDFDKILFDEAGPAILQWMIDGAVQFAKDGYKLHIPAVVQTAINSYKDEEDTISQFLAECCQQTGRVGVGELYKAYRDWMTNRGDETNIIRQNEFSKRLEVDYKQRGIGGHRKIWVDLSLTKTV